MYICRPVYTCKWCVLAHWIFDLQICAHWKPSITIYHYFIYVPGALCSWNSRLKPEIRRRRGIFAQVDFENFSRERERKKKPPQNNNNNKTTTTTNQNGKKNNPRFFFLLKIVSETHKRLKRTLLNQTKQDRMQIFQGIFFKATNSTNTNKSLCCCQLGASRRMCARLTR